VPAFCIVCQTRNHDEDRLIKWKNSFSTLFFGRCADANLVFLSLSLPCSSNLSSRHFTPNSKSATPAADSMKELGRRNLRSFSPLFFFFFFFSLVTLKNLKMHRRKKAVKMCDSPLSHNYVCPSVFIYTFALFRETLHRLLQLISFLRPESVALRPDTLLPGTFLEKAFSCMRERKREREREREGGRERERERERGREFERERERERETHSL
jgi:hypothetical protein